MTIWNKIKEFFTGEPTASKTDAGIDSIGEDKKGYPPYKLDPKMEVDAIFKGIDGNGRRLFDVNGVILDAEDRYDAIRKYLRIKKETV